MNLMVRRVTSAAAMWKRAKSTRQNHALRCTRTASAQGAISMLKLNQVVGSQAA